MDFLKDKTFDFVISTAFLWLNNKINDSFNKLPFRLLFDVFFLATMVLIKYKYPNFIAEEVLYVYFGFRILKIPIKYTIKYLEIRSDYGISIIRICYNLIRYRSLEKTLDIEYDALHMGYRLIHGALNIVGLAHDKERVIKQSCEIIKKNFFPVFGKSIILLFIFMGTYYLMFRGLRYTALYHIQLF